jgi:hypothetical protein
MEIMSVAFRGPCARRQEAYFAISELTDDEEEARDLRSGPLVEAPERIR